MKRTLTCLLTGLLGYGVLLFACTHFGKRGW